MATLNFPDAPDTGDTYFDTNAGFNYEWNGSVWISKDLARPNTTKEIDDISSGFDGSDTTFTLQVDGVNIVPQDVKQLVITVGGAVQNPGDDYTVSGSTLTFTTAPSASVSFYGTFLGSAVSLNTISAASVSPSSFTTTSNYTVGSINVSGASTITNFIFTGFTTITNPDVTYLNTGIGTVSNVILTQDNSGLGATIGAAVGVVTYYGDGTNLTGTAVTMMPLSYDPGISSTSQQATTNIITTWNRPIEAGSGTITIREGSASGTVVDQFVVGSSSSITFSGNQLTLNPADKLGFSTTFYVTYPAGSIKAVGGQHENSQVISDFTTAAIVYGLFQWGEDEAGQLGQNNRTNYSSPLQVPGTTWTKFFRGNRKSSSALTSDNTLWAWGLNNYGQLGQNNTASHSSPTQIPGTTWNFGIVGQTAYAIKTDATLWAWGYNGYGDLGVPSIGTDHRSSPVQLPGTTWSDVTSHVYNASAFKTDGSLWFWGYNDKGQLGQNNRTNQSSPTQVPGTTWVKVEMGTEGVLGTRTDGTLWSWGNNIYGQLGLNSTVKYSSPVQIPGTTWSTGRGKFVVQSSSASIKTDGTLWSWGRNDRGSLGQNNRTEYSSPMQIPGTTWQYIFHGENNYMASKTDGTLWSWGQNDSGQLAHNNVVYTSSPVQIPGTWDLSKVYHGAANPMAAFQIID